MVVGSWVSRMFNLNTSVVMTPLHGGSKKNIYANGYMLDSFEGFLFFVTMLGLLTLLTPHSMHSVLFVYFCITMFSRRGGGPPPGGLTEAAPFSCGFFSKKKVRGPAGCRF